MNRTHKFKRLFKYEIEATRRALASLDSVPDDGRTSGEFARARAVLAHMQIARRVWLSRLGGAEPITVTDWFPLWEADRVRADAAQVDALWSAYLARLEDRDLDRVIEYKSSDGTPFVSTADDILTHAFNHSTYHRGQVARLVTEAGGERASTDYIFLAREGLLD
ncbi:MAG: DinB family protein [Phycisphaerales bacterium]|nr:DinB family protein [Phycisphaerales bacterium]